MTTLNFYGSFTVYVVTSLCMLVSLPVLLLLCRVSKSFKTGFSTLCYQMNNEGKDLLEYIQERIGND